ncbi:MAG: hypothetical protein CVU46_08940 [Chloroflexi bacterium HGW-Chloroflexi-8]|nr:MAG: hypothetical protein CVU46_08940 [Chloroflexi bacterium HGW-Chloroflexi-8]
MERTIPRTATEEIDLYLRTIYSLLRSTTEIHIKTIEEVHASMGSLLHPNARNNHPDMSAFVYSLLRLPECMPDVRVVILGQSAEVFKQHGFENVESWRAVTAVARRRRCFFDGDGKLACFIASRSDIEDVLPVMTAYQIEWNKINFLLQRISPEFDLESVISNSKNFVFLANSLLVSEEDLKRLQIIWKENFIENIREIKNKKCDFRVNLLGGPLSEYWRATRAWWENIERKFPDLLKSPIYFVSSNTHSISNMVTGFALQKREIIEDFIYRKENSELLKEWNLIISGNEPASIENFLYYSLKKYQQTEEGKYLLQEQIECENNCGILRVASRHYFDVDAQIIQINKLCPDHFDPRLKTFVDWDFLKKSDALILNIDYPLGLAAYNILTKIAEHVNPILGIYIMGKAATLNGVLGDIIIPGVVQDEHSQNTYLFQNAFAAKDIIDNLIYGTVLDNQKAVTVLGTFLQNSKLADVFYREGYSDIEMEAGPFLSAIYEMYRPTRHPTNEIVNLYGIPFDLGIIHYVSDTPLSKGRNLGAGTLSYFGMDSTYAASSAIIHRIFKLEVNRTKTFKN